MIALMLLKNSLSEHDLKALEDANTVLCLNCGVLFGVHPHTHPYAPHWHTCPLCGDFSLVWVLRGELDG